MSNYRKNPGKSDYSFAFSRELRNATRGVTYALANSVDPLGKKNLVPNWGELINVNPNRWVNFIQRVYNREGQLLKTYNVKLAPLGEVDTQCGHENGQGAYLCEFIPEDGSTQYLSTVARYSENSLRRRPAETYNFAFALEGRAGADEPIYAPIRNERGECWSEQTWLEIANVREVPVIATVTYRDADGLALGSSGPTKVTIQPKAQVYLHASGMLTIGGVGSAEVSANQPGSIVAQSMFYYYDCKTNRVQSGFASALRTAQEQLQIGTYNTNLGMSNYLQVVSITPNPFDLNVTFGWRSPGANDLQILSPGSVRIDPRESVRIGLNSGPFARSPNTYGTVTLSSGLSRSYIAEVIRVREDSSGRIDFISTTSVR
jgi:hypothetical protein